MLCDYNIVADLQNIGDICADLFEKGLRQSVGGSKRETKNLKVEANADNLNQVATNALKFEKTDTCLCYGVFISILNICSLSNISKVELGEIILSCLPCKQNDFDYEYIKSINDCLTRLTVEITMQARDANISEVSNMIASRILPHIDRSKRNNLIRALIEIIDCDADIEADEHLLEIYEEGTKREIVKMTDVVLSDFIAGLLVYILHKTDNLRGQKFISSIDSAYIEKFSDDTRYKA
jgi:ATP-dependent Lon protease